MAQILVRNLDESLVSRLKSRAAHNNRSLQAEVKLILEQSTRLDAKAAQLMARQISKDLQYHPFADSSSLIREDREK